MNAIILQQTATHLSRQTRRWDRRLRLVTSTIWLPRGMIVGLLIGIAVAIISRLRPWLLPDEIALVAVSAVALSSLSALATVWVWPRSLARNARFFDLLFDLKERVSTALEVSGGLIPIPETLAEHQLNDAVSAARKVDVRARLPFQVRFWELMAVCALGALLLYMLIADNPMSDKIRNQRELNSAINQQIQNLDQAIEEIEANEALTPEEKEALTQPLEDAQSILQQPGVSQQEAVAAMAEASDRLNDMQDGMNAQDEAAYQDAANGLNQSQMTSDLAQAFQKPDLSEAGDAMDQMAEDMVEEELTQQQRDELAERLEQTANEIEETNPALAQKLRETAEALREGDMETAQETAREAGELMRQQEEALENSPSAQAAQNAQEQVNESQHDLSQAGQEGEQQQSIQQGDNQQNQQGQQSQQGDQQEQEQQGQQGQQGQQDQQGQQSSQEGAQSGEEGSQQNGGSGEGQEQSQGQSPSGESSASGQQTGSGEAQQAQQGGGGTEAGEGEGGAGSDNAAGVTAQNGPGETSSDNSTGGEIQEFQPEFEPSTIGGQSNDVIDVSSGEADSTEGETVSEGEFGPNPEGESTLSYTGVYNEYRDIVSSALESGRIPLDQRDVIHDYFSSLDQ